MAKDSIHLFFCPRFKVGKGEKGVIQVPLTCNGSKLLQDRAGPLGGIPKHNFCFPLKLGQDMGVAQQGSNSGHCHPS